VKETVRELGDSGFWQRQNEANGRTSLSSVEQLAPTATPLPSDPTSEQRIPLSEAQKQLFFLARLSRNAMLAYRESFAIKLKGRLVVSAMRQALSRLVARHEALRTVIDADGETQRVLPSVAVQMNLVDCTAATATEREWRQDKWVRQNDQTEFD